MRNEVVCRFGSSVVGAIRTSDTGVLCLLPMMAGTVPVAIAANGLDFQPTADVEVQRLCRRSNSVQMKGTLILGPALRIPAVGGAMAA